MFGKESVSGRIGQAAGRVFLLLIFFTFLLFAVGAGAAEQPAWVLFEKGLALFEEGELDEALEMITLSVGEGEPTAEQLYWTGRIFEAEGDALLARRRYEEALEKARFLYIPEQKWDIYYSLSDIYLNASEYDDYEQILLTVFDEEMRRNSEIIRREHSYVQMLKEDGSDKLLLLYRLKLGPSLEASIRLGRFYNGREMWKSSLIKNLYVFLTLFSGGIELLMAENPEFAFPVDMEEAWEADPEFLIDLYERRCEEAGVYFAFRRDLKTLEPLDMEGDRKAAEELIRRKNPDFGMSPSSYVLLKLENYVKRGGIMDLEELYASLYFLGEALYQEGCSERARELWGLLDISSRRSSWQTLGSKKIEDPETETPFLKY